MSKILNVFDLVFFLALIFIFSLIYNSIENEFLLSIRQFLLIGVWIIGSGSYSILTK